MPETTPAIKTNAVRDLGGEVILTGDTYDDAHAHARKAGARARKLVFIHPFDDPAVIAGQGTIGMEILQQAPGSDRCDLRTHWRWRPDRRYRDLISSRNDRMIRIVGVEPEDSAAMRDSIAAGERPVSLDHVGIFR